MSILGVTLIFEPDVRRLRRLAEDLDALDELTCIDLAILHSADFRFICHPAGVSWHGREPVILDDEDGLIVYPVSEQALRHVLTHGAAALASMDRADLEIRAKSHWQSGELVILQDAQTADLQQLAEFVRRHGTQHIFALETF